ncbi:hypothetical protein [Dongia sp.]|uniref:hypothetical protein n=1 Tax=Dongia sp. TaxID=1977262 RepID=UPI0035B447B3
MSKSVYEFMEESYPALNDLLINVAVNAGSFEEKRIETTVARFIESSDVARLKRTAHDLDLASEKLSLDRAVLSDFMNYVFDSDAEALETMRAMRDLIRKGIAAESAKSS